MMNRLDYGTDAPGMVRDLLIAGTVALLLLLLLPAIGFWPGRPWGILLAVLFALIAAYGLGLGLLVLYVSRIGKLRTRDQLIDLVSWTGHERVLDIGCGHGLMLIAAAKRLSSGKAVGIDSWHSEDQAENRPEITLGNARLEGVMDRIEIHTADMRQLPFSDESFDVVLTHWVVHNLSKPEERCRAIDEMVRVLKPGGFLILGDIEHHREYAARLDALDLRNNRCLGLSWKTALMAAVSFGKFRPTALVARKSPPLSHCR
jgi:arsenite methyltransferase